MEELLTPQVCMDIGDTPLMVGKDSSEDDNSSVSSELDEDEKIHKLFLMEFKDASQVPEPLTKDEIEAKKGILAVGESTIQYHRLHCTACNVHLGSAPIGFFNRFIHPILKVLLCKSCYDFYTSGEFDKDEDGSEMYCRWCGQGGKVMCCSTCAFVFCQKCVRQNFGKKALEIIKNSDDWKCYACNPSQLINPIVICKALYEFTIEEIRLAKAFGNSERLKIDHSRCCTRQRSSLKRKRDEDVTYIPFIEEKNRKSEVNLKNRKSLNSTPACGPRTIWMKDEQSPSVQSTMNITSRFVKIRPKLTEDDTVQERKDEEQLVCAPDVSCLLPNMEPSPPMISPPISSALPTLQSKTFITQVQNKIRPILSPMWPPPASAAPISGVRPTQFLFRYPTNNVTKIVQQPSNKSTPLVAVVPSQLAPGLKHEWYDRASVVISTIAGKLSTTMIGLNKQQSEARTVEGLAAVHNKLQELLSTSVNSLIQVRRSLRTSFLSDLNKLRFMSQTPVHLNSKNSNGIGGVQKTEECDPLAINLPTASTSKQDIDDVIVIDSESPKKSERQRADGGRPYLKVRSVSQLHKIPSDCIMIPDEPSQDETNGRKSPVKKENIDDVENKSCERDGETEEEEKRCHEENGALKKSGVEGEMTTECAENSLTLKNSLIESRISQFVEENKNIVTPLSEDQLLKALSVRVKIATKFRSVLPENGLKNANFYIEDAEDVIPCSVLPINPRSTEKPPDDGGETLNNDNGDCSEDNANTEENIPHDFNSQLEEDNEKLVDPLEENNPCDNVNKTEELNSSVEGVKESVEGCLNSGEIELNKSGECANINESDKMNSVSELGCPSSEKGDDSKL